jgi:hypothetical protein
MCFLLFFCKIALLKIFLSIIGMRVLIFRSNLLPEGLEISASGRNLDFAL